MVKGDKGLQAVSVLPVSVGVLGWEVPVSRLRQFTLWAVVCLGLAMAGVRPDRAPPWTAWARELVQLHLQ